MGGEWGCLRHQHCILRLVRQLGIIQRVMQPPALLAAQRGRHDQLRRLQQVAQFDQVGRHAEGAVVILDLAFQQLDAAGGAFQPLGQGCPTLAGNALDASSHWFDPARAGNGYSVQTWQDGYQFFAAFTYDSRGYPIFLAAERAGLSTASEDLAHPEHGARMGALAQALQVRFDGDRPVVMRACGQRLDCAPIPDFLMDMVDAGGLLPLLRRRKPA